MEWASLCLRVFVFDIRRRLTGLSHRNTYHPCFDDAAAIPAMSFPCPDPANTAPAPALGHYEAREFRAEDEVEEKRPVQHVHVCGGAVE